MNDGHADTPLWREEFPIEAVEERYVTRRQFLRFLTLTGFGMLAGNLVILAKSLLRRPETYPEKVVARAGEIPPGRARLFSYPRDNDPCILLHTRDGGFTAFSTTCTHLSCPVHYAGATGRLECPCHRGAFSALDGRVLQGPPERPLPRIRLETRGDVLVAVGMVGEDEP